MEYSRREMCRIADRLGALRISAPFLFLWRRKEHGR